MHFNKYTKRLKTDGHGHKSKLAERCVSSRRFQAHCGPVHAAIIHLGCTGYRHMYVLIKISVFSATGH